jgi:hypothetical protein
VISDAEHRLLELLECGPVDVPHAGQMGRGIGKNDVCRTGERPGNSFRSLGVREVELEELNRLAERIDGAEVDADHASPRAHARGENLKPPARPASQFDDGGSRTHLRDATEQIDELVRRA